MEQHLLEEIQQTISKLPNQPNVTYLTAHEIAHRAEEFGTRTIFGNFNYVSTVKNLSTALTVYLGSDKVETRVSTQKKRDIKKSAPGTIRQVHNYLKNAPLARINCLMGDQSSYTPQCALYISTYRKDCIRIAHMVAETLFPQCDSDGPQMNIVVIPEWQEKERQILVFPEIGVTYILGTDYYGEVKNAFLRMAMWNAKQKGMLGLHAGTKILRARNADGKLRKVGMVMFGIAATGKTTHSCHNHGLTDTGEGVEILQDDVVFWRKDGSSLGSERGFYIKTEALTPEV